MIIAQGKAAACLAVAQRRREAAALGSARPTSSPPFLWFAPKAFGANHKKGGKFVFDPLPRAALVPRLPWATLISSLWDFSRARTPGQRRPHWLRASDSDM